MALVEDTNVVDTEPSSEDIAIWAAVLVIAADALALYALLKARKEKASQPDNTEDKTQDFEIRKTNKSRTGSRR